ncbi:hypothetical protein EVAR_87817_1 [Eumeta japonica]|uniref:Reverse transcriptase domain-containing protein n=1 Tax=Eumeta variegata TaxID=151549 RepID=A0A4C1Z1G0_EUMVA|nr:hypothetical protein EVAR_87817_1 [Eumeta japonica]
MKALKRMKNGKAAGNDRVSSEMLRGGKGIETNLRDSCLHDLKEYEYGLRMDKLSAKCLLYADDQVILAPLAFELQEIAKPVNGKVMVKKEILDIVDTTLFLGFTLDAKLRWNSHITKLAKGLVL